MCVNQTDNQVCSALDEAVKIMSQIAVNQTRIVVLLGRQLPGLTDGDRAALVSGTKTTLPRIQMLQRQIEEIGSQRTNT